MRKTSKQSVLNLLIETGLNIYHGPFILPSTLLHYSIHSHNKFFISWIVLISHYRVEEIEMNMISSGY